MRILQVLFIAIVIGCNSTPPPVVIPTETKESPESLAVAQFCEEARSAANYLDYVPERKQVAERIEKLKDLLSKLPPETDQSNVDVMKKIISEVMMAEKYLGFEEEFDALSLPLKSAEMRANTKASAAKIHDYITQLGAKQ